MPIPFELVSKDLRDSFYGRARWYLKTSWLPRRCDQSGQWLWLTKAYRGEAVWHGHGDPIRETRWISKFEFLKLLIK